MFRISIIWLGADKGNGKIKSIWMNITWSEEEVFIRNFKNFCKTNTWLGGTLIRKFETLENIQLD